MDIIGKGRVVGYISAVLVVVSIVLLFVPGLNLGIDFKSGTTFTYAFEGPEIDSEDVRAAVAAADHEQASEAVAEPA